MKLIRMFVVFFAALLAAMVAVVALVAPSVLPPGIGVSRIPVSVAKRSSLVGQGAVAMIENTGNTALKGVEIICRDKTDTSKTKTIAVDRLEPKGTVQVGWAEGWTFREGDSLAVRARGYFARRWVLTKEGFR